MTVNLYAVTCVHQTFLGCSEETVYVVAPDPTTAQDAALAAVREREWKWDDYAADVRLVATSGGRHPALLVT